METAARVGKAEVDVVPGAVRSAARSVRSACQPEAVPNRGLHGQGLLAPMHAKRTHLEGRVEQQLQVEHAELVALRLPGRRVERAVRAAGRTCASLGGMPSALPARRGATTRACLLLE